jgi:hypothetical protein
MNCNAQIEHMFSGLAREADISERARRFEPLRGRREV